MEISKLNNLFGEEWVSLLSEYLTGPDFDKLGSDIARARYSYPILPSTSNRDLIFKAFKSIQPSQIKVVILGEDPNLKEGVYDGYPYSDNNVLNMKKINPVTANILRCVDNRFPEYKESLEGGRIDVLDLERWVKQGVFLVNTALTLIENKPGSHVALWRRFTIKWIEALSEYNRDIVWLLWTDQTLKFLPYIKYGKIITEGDPRPSNTKNPFGAYSLVSTNDYLKDINKKEIIW